MARIWQTGWEMGSNHCNVAATGTIMTVPTSGSWSTYSLRGTTNAGPDVTALGSTFTELYAGGRFYIDGTAAGPDRLWSFRSDGTDQDTVCINYGSGKIEVKRGSESGTLLGQGSILPVTRTWNFIECRIVLSDTVGVVDLHLNGVQILSLTGQDTLVGGSITNQIAFAGNTIIFMDEFYVNDTSGSQNTGFAGDIRISPYIPNAAGDVTQLTPSTGNNWACVDDRPPNDATDYVSDAGTANYDLYNIPNTTGVATVQAVSLWLRAQKSDAGAKSIAHKLKSGSTEDTGADQALTTSWAYYPKHYSNDPTDSNAWTPSKVDNLQIGAKAR